MAEIEEALYWHLANHWEVAALVDDRVYPALRQKNLSTLPAITYQTISKFTPRHNTSASGMATKRIQVNCWAESVEDAETLAVRVRLAVNGYRGLMGALAAQVHVLSVECDDEADVAEEEPQLDAARSYGVRQDFLITYRETAAVNN